MPLRLKSLSTELTIVFTTLVAGLVALLSFFAFQMASRSLEEAVRRDLFNMVDQATSALDKEIQERVREVQTISLAPTIRNGALDMSETHVTIPVSQRNEDSLRSRFGGQACLDELPEVTRHLQTVLASHNYIAALILTDRFGISVSCTGESRQIVNSSETWWQEAMRRGISLSNLTPNPTTGAYQYAISIAIPDGKRSPAGVLRAVFNLNQMQGSLNAMRIGEHGFVMAMGRTGTIFSYPKGEYLWRKVQDVPELSQLTRVVASRAPKGTLIYEPLAETTAEVSVPGASRSPSAASVTAGPHPASLASAPEDSWILAYGRMFRPASLGPLGWTVVATVSRAEVIAPIYAIRYRVAAFGGTVVFFAVLLVWYLSRRLARPLIDLARRADLIAAGDLGVYLSIPEKNEIGRLASALASMVDSLSAANRTLTRTNLNLEIIVADRTSELRDKTELLEEQSKQVLEASRLKSQFLANMSHELRTPLNAILALSDILAQRISGDLNEEQVKQVTIINRSGGNLLRLINDILDLSKIEAGRMEVHEDVFDLKTTLATLRDTIEPLAADKGLAFTIVPDPALPSSMKSDDPKIRQVLLNLLGNAVKFTERGSVTLTLSRRYRKLPGTDEEPPPLTDEGPFWLELEVKDTGVGISPQALQHIFEEFQQADGSTTRKYGGSGLGLAISKKLVELLGGELSVESAMGRGSTFRALIPVEGVASAEATIEARRPAGAGLTGPAAPGAATSLPSDRRALPAGTRGLVDPDESLGDGTPGRPWVTPLKEHPVPISPRFLDIRDDANSLLPHRPTLLVVDDDPESLYVYRQFLSRQGYQVIFAISGEQVLDKARQYKPVAIILDLMLPQKSGWEVLEELKFAEDLREIPVIIASALDHRDRGLCAGAFRFLTKPMSERQLSSVLQELERARKKDVHRVLVIDDDPVELGIARTLFEKAGLDVTTKDNGEEAVIWARNESPDIIVLDLLMPAMDGFEVLSRLKSDQATAGIPVLIYTAKDVTEEDRRRLLPSVRRIFPKVPLQIEEMLEELEKALQTVPHAIRPTARPEPELSRPPQDAPEGPAGTASGASRPPGPRAARPQAEPGGELSEDRIPATGIAAAPSGLPASDTARAEVSWTGDPVPTGTVVDGTPDETAGDEPDLVETGPVPRYDVRDADSRSLPRIRILLVEDDTANQYTIGFLLRSAGYEVIIAENGEEGLQAAERVRPHMILMDMMMPVMSGFEATRILKSRSDLKEIPVIALTAAAMAGDRERTLAAGCDDYVSKPVDRVLLLERVRHWKAVCLGELSLRTEPLPAMGEAPGSLEGARERENLQVAVGTSVGAQREDRRE
ncbi:MAG TPA: response regulator [Candidatus Saccharimonadales bacterium]|nr:response regulator [Candidatus Saccharimonadales bacterium]